MEIKNNPSRFSAKKIALGLLVLSLSIGLGWIIKNTVFTPKELHTYGPHAYLLEEKRELREFQDYCYSHKMKTWQMFIYEAKYNVTVSPSGAYIKNSLPIWNPDQYKSIIGIYSSIPFQDPRLQSTTEDTLLIDENWLNQHGNTSLKDPLTVKYLFQITDIADLPISDTLSSLASEELIQEMAQDKKYESVCALAKELRSKMPADKQDNLKEILITYSLWIKKNISYPDTEVLDYLREEKYINLLSSEQTLKSKIGVCEDDANLLKDLLRSQGIESKMVYGKLADSMTYKSLYPDNVGYHAIMMVKTGDGYYFVDPTVQDSEKMMDYTLSNGKVIQVTSHEQSDDMIRYPMFPSELEGVFPPIGKVTFTLKDIQVIMHH